MSNWEALGIDVASGKISRQLIKLLVAAIGRGCSWVVAGACWRYLKASPWTSAGLSKHLLGTWLFSGDATKGTGAWPWGCHVPLVYLQSQQASGRKKQVFEIVPGCLPWIGLWGQGGDWS